MRALLIVTAVIVNAGASVGCGEPTDTLGTAGTATSAVATATGVARGAESAAPGSARPDKAEKLPLGDLSGINWIHDAYAAALADAKAARRPLFVNVWAPWRPTCLSMRELVLKDGALRRFADRFTWLAVNTEKSENAAFLAKFPPDPGQTFYVVDPMDESLHGRWLGAASIDRLSIFLEDSTRAVGLAWAKGPSEEPMRLAREANQAAVHKKWAEAVKLYEQALAIAPDRWPRKPDTLVAMMAALHSGGAYADCLSNGIRWMADTGESSSTADFVYSALACASKLDPDEGRVVMLRRAAEEGIASLLGDHDAPLSPHVRGEALRTLWSVREDLDDAAGARKAAEERLAILEAAARFAPTPLGAAVYDGARTDTYLYLARGEEAIAMLEASERALPEDYNPPHHLARVYFALARWDEAVTAIDRAIARAYGPRQASIIGFKATILEKAGRLEEARAAIELQIKTWASLPPPLLPKEEMKAARKRLAELRAGM